jgi:hypothetical protein
MCGLPEFLVVITFVNESSPDPNGASNEHREEELLSNVAVVWENRAGAAANQKSASIAYAQREISQVATRCASAIVEAWFHGVVVTMQWILQWIHLPRT